MSIIVIKEVYKMKSSTRFLVFIKKYGYWFVLALALVVLITIVSLSIATQQNKVSLDTGDTEPTQPSSVEEINFAVPVASANVFKEYSNSALQYNKTLNQWQAHKAIDFLADEGTDVYAVMDGTIKEVSYSYLMGNVVKLDVGNGMIVVYASLQNDVPVKVGDTVKKGAVIGKVGKTAKSEAGDGAHLHLEVWLDDENVDPSIYLDLENK